MCQERRVDPSLSNNIQTSPIGVGLVEPTHLEALGREFESSKGLLADSPKVKSLVSFSRALKGGKEGNIRQTWEEGEFKDDLA